MTGIKLTTERKARMDDIDLNVHKKFLAAMIEMLANYEEKKRSPSCLLCKAGRCIVCPWVTIPNLICVDFIRNLRENTGRHLSLFLLKPKVGEVQVPNKAWHNWREIRIPQLKAWISFYESYIESKEKK